MTDDHNQPDQDQAYRDAEQAAHAGAAALLEKVGDRVGLHAGAKAVFGEPVKEGGRTVVPVAQVIFGMGAGPLVLAYALLALVVLRTLVRLVRS